MKSLVKHFVHSASFQQDLLTSVSVGIKQRAQGVIKQATPISTKLYFLTLNLCKTTGRKKTMKSSFSPTFLFFDRSIFWKKYVAHQTSLELDHFCNIINMLKSIIRIRW